MYSSVLLLHNLLLPLPKSYHGTRCTSKCKAFLSTFHPGGRRVKPEKKGLSPQLKNSNKQLHTLFPICPTGKLYASFSGLNLILQKPRQMAIERQLSVSARMVMFFFYAKFYSPSSVGKESASNVGDLSSIPGLGRSPGEGNGNTFFLPGESHGQRSLVGYSPQSHKRRT